MCVGVDFGLGLPARVLGKVVGVVAAVPGLCGAITRTTDIHTSPVVKTQMHHMTTRKKLPRLNWQRLLRLKWQQLAELLRLNRRRLLRLKW